MLETLRIRLLASYVTILLITLGLIGGGLLVFLRSRPLPTDDIVSDLTATLLDVRVVDAVRPLGDAIPQLTATLLDVRVLESVQSGAMGPRPGPGATLEQRVIQFLVDEATLGDVRVMVITDGGEVHFDSSGSLAEGTVLPGIERTPLGTSMHAMMATTVYQGTFADPAGQQWVFVSQALRMRPDARGDTPNLVIAQPVPTITNLDQRFYTFLADEAAERDVRVLLITEDNQVLFDSEAAFEAMDTVDDITRTPLVTTSTTRPASALYKGEFSDPDGQEWVYVSQTWDRLTTPLHIAVADPLPRPSLREVFRLFGDEFLSPLAQAGLFGLLIALGLAALIARSVARPLQQISHAAQRIAHGDFQQRVPVQGPQEVRSLATTFNEMTGRVAAIQQAQRDFLANVSHDLRTPLTSIQGFSQAIEEGVTNDPDSTRRAAKIIHDEASRLHRMVEGLLDMARLESGELDALSQAVQLSELLNAVGDSLSVKASDKGVALALEVPPHLPRIAGDGDRLAQVFTNLVDNAIKHTHAGGGVSLRADLVDEGILVTVRDTGEGIPPADLSRIFERFYQVDKSRQRRRGDREGLGLGLSITRQIVAAHGGVIRVASKVGEGTTFTVWLPLPRPDMSTVSMRR